MMAQMLIKQLTGDPAALTVERDTTQIGGALFLILPEIERESSAESDDFQILFSLTLYSAYKAFRITQNELLADGVQRLIYSYPQLTMLYYLHALRELDGIIDFAPGDARSSILQQKLLAFTDALEKNMGSGIRGLIGYLDTLITGLESFFQNSGAKFR